MLNKSIPEKKFSKLKLIVLDSDGVTVKKGTRINECETPERYECLIVTSKIEDRLASKINLLKTMGYHICICSGRSLLYLQSMFSKIIDEHLSIIAENGNILLHNGKIEHLSNLSNTYFKSLSEIREEAKKLPIDGFEPKNTFLTIHSKELKEVYNIAKRYPNLQCMYVGGEAFDIQLKNISKGKALRKLIKMMGLKKENVIGIGDSVNDIEMLEECGIPVSADIKKIRCEYYTLEENILPGEVFINNILSRRLINFNL